MMKTAGTDRGSFSLERAVTNCQLAMYPLASMPERAVRVSEIAACVIACYQ